MTRDWTLERIRRFPRGDPTIKTDDFRQIGDQLAAFWENLADPGDLKYHAIMVSGLHTNGFVNVSTYMAETALATALATQMIERNLGRYTPDVVVGPGNAAITLSFEVARILRVRHGFTEKDAEGKPTKIGGRMRISPGERVLIVNELMSTADGSTLQCIEGVLRHQPRAQILPFAVVLVNRSGTSRLADGTEVRSEFDFSMKTWKAEKCPYCAVGSIAIKPKLTDENWLKLIGRME